VMELLARDRDFGSEGVDEDSMAHEAIVFGAESPLPALRGEG
jgi:hypothetical protein